MAHTNAKKKWSRKKSARHDAAALLKADHRQIEASFEVFETSRSDAKKDLATKTCDALTVHTQIDEKIFYPAFIDEYYDAKVKVLSEMIKHHAKQEEQRSGMFFAARDAHIDLIALGETLVSPQARADGAAHLVTLCPLTGWHRCP